MRKILPALALIAASSTAFSHGIIPFVGSNLSWYQVKGGGGAYLSKPVVGVNAGAMADIRMSTMFSLQLGLQYNLTGGKFITDYYPHGPATEYLFRIHAVQLPIMLFSKLGEEDRGHFFVGAGFYVTANRVGTLDIQGSNYGSHVPGITPRQEKERLHFTENGQNYAPFDFGLNIGAGYRLANGLEFYGFFQKGYTNTHYKYYMPNVRTYQVGLAVRYALKFTTSSAKHRAQPEAPNNPK